MQAHYRTDYAGEFVILNTTFKGGKKIQEHQLHTQEAVAAVVGQMDILVEQADPE